MTQVQWQKAIRQQEANRPLTKAVAILHALEYLRDDLKGQEVDQDLQESFGKIGELAKEMAS